MAKFINKIWANLLKYLKVTDSLNLIGCCPYKVLARITFSQTSHTPSISTSCPRSGAQLNLDIPFSDNFLGGRWALSFCSPHQFPPVIGGGEGGAPTTGNRCHSPQRRKNENCPACVVCRGVHLSWQRPSRDYLNASEVCFTLFTVVQIRTFQ